MANPLSQVLLTTERLKAPDEIVDPAVGAVVDFWGIVRARENDREIEGIEYEVHREMAEHQLQKIAQQAAADFPLNLVVIHHRIGFILAGESSLFVRVASQHRAEAFRASQWIVDELKRKAPIWKKARDKIDNRSVKKSGVTSKTASIP